MSPPYFMIYTWPTPSTSPPSQFCSPEPLSEKTGQPSSKCAVEKKWYKYKYLMWPMWSIISLLNTFIKNVIHIITTIISKNPIDVPGKYQKKISSLTNTHQLIHPIPRQIIKIETQPIALIHILVTNFSTGWFMGISCHLRLLIFRNHTNLVKFIRFC